MSKAVAPLSIKAERIQTREKTDSTYIDELAERMLTGDIFPAITIFTDGKNEWLADGIHRLDAAIQAKCRISVEYRQGNRADAVEFALGANAHHGLRRTIADKRRTVAMALEAFPKRSSRAIAELCGVSHFLVDAQRKGSQLAENASSSGEFRIGRDGKSRRVKPKPGVQADESGTDAQPAPRPEPVTPEREWGEGSALEDVQADLEEAVRRIRDVGRLLRKVFAYEDKQITRPYCGHFSMMLLGELNAVAQTIKNEMPVGGTPKKPKLFREQKVEELAG